MRMSLHLSAQDRLKCPDHNIFQHTGVYHPFTNNLLVYKNNSTKEGFKVTSNKAINASAPRRAPQLTANDLGGLSIKPAFLLSILLVRRRNVAPKGGFETVASWCFFVVVCHVCNLQSC